MVRNFRAGISSFHLRFPIHTRSANADPQLVPANLSRQLQHEHGFEHHHCVLKVKKKHALLSSPDFHASTLIFTFSLKKSGEGDFNKR